MTAKTATVLGCATALACGVLLGAGGLVRQASEHSPQPTWPDQKGKPGAEVRVPPGLYTAIVASCEDAGAGSRAVLLSTPAGEFRFAVPFGGTVVIPFQPAWQMGQEGTLRWTGGSVSAWGITTSGPVKFEPKEDKKK